MKKITFEYKKMILVAYIYLIIPIIVFFMTWLRLTFALLFSVLLLLGLYNLYQKEYAHNTERMSLPLSTVLFGSLLLLIILLLTGQGGFFYQYGDNQWRNAIYQDLISQKWPVIYKGTNNGLCYYFLHWIVPAMISKLFKNSEHALLIARIVLTLWTFSGLFIAIIHLAFSTGIKGKGHFYLMLLIFCIWGGLNIIGGFITNIFGVLNSILYQWWTDFEINGQLYAFMYRYNLDQIASVYNQTIAPWIAIPILLKKPHINTFAFLGLCVLPYAPFPMLGIAIMMIGIALNYFRATIFKTSLKTYFKLIFSLPNICAIISIFLPFLLFFKCNVAASSGANGHFLTLYIPFSKLSLTGLALLFLFYLLSFGLYAICIYRENKNTFIFYLIILILLFCPLLRIGTMGDFCWNVSVPAYYTLMILVIQFFIKKVHLTTIKSNVTKTVALLLPRTAIPLIICLSLASINIFNMLSIQLNYTYMQKSFNGWANAIVTFDGRKIGDHYSGDGNWNVGNTDLILQNFLVPDPQNHFFYKYLAKQH